MRCVLRCPVGAAPRGESSLQGCLLIVWRIPRKARPEPGPPTGRRQFAPGIQHLTGTEPFERLWLRRPGAWSAPKANGRTLTRAFQSQKANDGALLIAMHSCDCYRTGFAKCVRYVRADGASRSRAAQPTRSRGRKTAINAHHSPGEWRDLATQRHGTGRKPRPRPGFGALNRFGTAFALSPTPQRRPRPARRSGQPRATRAPRHDRHCANHCRPQRRRQTAPDNDRDMPRHTGQAPGLPGPALTPLSNFTWSVL